MKTIAWLAAIGTMAMGLVYMVVSLNRWEWNRALFFGLIVLIAEVGIATALILRRLTRIETAKLDPAILAILRETRPASPHRFGWLEDSTTQMNVFITFLVGGGRDPVGPGVGGGQGRGQDLHAGRRGEAGQANSGPSATRGAACWSTR